jgi:hypothetical protein
MLTKVRPTRVYKETSAEVACEFDEATGVFVVHRLPWVAEAALEVRKAAEQLKGTWFTSFAAQTVLLVLEHFWPGNWRVETNDGIWQWLRIEQVYEDQPQTPLCLNYPSGHHRTTWDIIAGEWEGID